MTTTSLTHAARSRAVRAVLALGVGTATFVMTPGAQAAAGAAAERVDAKKEVLYEIVVTARKREENVLKVPISISVIGDEDLNRLGGRDLRDLEFAVPNVTFWDQNDLTKSTVTIRGVSTSVRNIGTEVSFATYLDGILLARPGAFYAAQNDLQQVEILRGPQGTIFGRNALAGAYSATTNKPRNELSAKTTIGYGNFDLIEARGMLNLPIVDDTLAARLSVNYQDRQGYVRNVFLNESTASYSPTSFRGALRWTPTADWTVDLSVDHTENKIGFYVTELMEDTPLFVNGCEYPNVVIDPSTGAPVLCGYVPGPRTIADGRPGMQEGKNFGVHLIADRKFGSGYSVQSLSAFRTTKTMFEFAAHYAPDPQGFGLWRDEDEQFSQELRLISPNADDSTPFDFVAGLYYLHLPATGSRLVNLEYDPDILPPGFVNETLTLVDQNTDSYAAYANANYYIGSFTVNAGVRYTREQKDYDFLQNGNPQSFTPIVLVRGGEFSESNVSPTLAVSYALADDLVTYAKWARGFKPGGFNVDFTVPELPDQYRAERMDLFEIGAKAELWEQRLRVNLAAFYQDYTDQQNPVIDAELQGAFVLNAGSAYAKGFEIEAAMRPVSALTLKAGYGYTDARYKDNQPTFDSPAIQLQIDRLAGQPLPRTNKHGANLSASYEFSVGDLGFLAVTADYTYRSSQDFAARSATGDVYRLNGNIVLSRNDTWKLELWGRNLLNEDYLASVFANQFINGRLGVIYGAPREYGVRLTYSYN